MTIPTPASFAQHLKAQKQLEKNEASSKDTARRTSSSTKPVSEKSRSSRKAKEPDTSSKVQPEPQESNSSGTSSESSKSQTPETKKVFVRKPHLTQRPLLHHEGLQTLRDSLPQNHKQNHKGGRPPKHIGSTSKKK